MIYDIVSFTSYTMHRVPAGKVSFMPCKTGFFGAPSTPADSFQTALSISKNRHRKLARKLGSIRESILVSLARLIEARMRRRTGETKVFQIRESRSPRPAQPKLTAKTPSIPHRARRYMLTMGCVENTTAYPQKIVTLSTAHPARMRITSVAEASLPSPSVTNAIQARIDLGLLRCISRPRL